MIYEKASDIAKPIWVFSSANCRPIDASRVWLKPLKTFLGLSLRIHKIVFFTVL